MSGPGADEALRQFLPLWPHGAGETAGAVDFVSAEGVFGWVIDTADPARALGVRLCCARMVLQEIAADRARRLTAFLLVAPLLRPGIKRHGRIPHALPRRRCAPERDGMERWRNRTAVRGGPYCRPAR